MSFDGHRQLQSNVTNVTDLHFSVRRPAQIADALTKKSVAKGTDIITQGDPADNFYIIEEGPAGSARRTPCTVHSKMTRFKKDLRYHRI